MDYIDEARAIKDVIVGYRRHFHMYPEASGEEVNTAAFIADKMKELGLAVTCQVGAPLPGIVAILHGEGGPGKTIAFRADMDALHIEEANEVPYKSRQAGLMHACGHDGHMAVLLGAATLLAQHKSLLKGNVKFIFQPQEEIYGGAVPMIDDGVMENPHVDAIFCLHMDPSIQAGHIGIRHGETLASSDRLIIKIFGKSAHGATPHLAVDPIVVSAHALLALQSVISREKDPLKDAVMSFGIIQGGHQPNAIADEVLLRGILRTFDADVREKVIHDIEAVLQGVTAAFHSTFRFTREKSYDSLINDDGMVDFLKTAAGNFMDGKIEDVSLPRMTVDDFAYYLHKARGAYYFLGCGNKEKGITQPLHNSSFDIDEEALVTGTAVQTALAMQYLKE